MALAASAVPILARPKEHICIGRRLVNGAVRQEIKSLESRIVDGSLESTSIYFLRCDTTCRPQSGAGHCKEKMVL